MISAVRCGGEKRPSHQPTPERVQDFEGRPEIQHGQLSSVPRAPKRLNTAGIVRCDDDRRDAAQQIDAKLDNVHPYDGPEAPDPGVNECHDADRQDPQREGSIGGIGSPVRDDCERNRCREDAHAIGQCARYEEDTGCGTSGSSPESSLESLVSGVLGAFEVPWEQELCDADPAHQITKGDLQECEIPVTADVSVATTDSINAHQGSPRCPRK